MTMRRTLLLCTFALVAFACTDDDEESVQPELPVDAAVPPAEPTPAPDAAPPVESKGIPLIDWVDDLVDHHTDDSSPPDTVDDKKIVDDEDPAKFDSRFQL